MRFNYYEVGGHVRDSILGIDSKDIDYTVVAEDVNTVDEAFYGFVERIKADGFQVFLETPDCLTVRAKFPNSNEVADFVIARKELYSHESRTPVTQLGTLYDDLLRRDFTLNALARSTSGEIIDRFDGYKDLLQGILRTPQDTFTSFNDDPLRVLRAIRFRVTRNFDFSDDIMRTLYYYPVQRMELISEERIREELYKCFAHNSGRTFKILQQLDSQGFKLAEWIFDNTSIWLNPTNKK